MQREGFLQQLYLRFPEQNLKIYADVTASYDNNRQLWIPPADPIGYEIALQTRHLQFGNDRRDPLAKSVIDFDPVKTISGDKHIVVGTEVAGELPAKGFFVFDQEDSLFIPYWHTYEKPQNDPTVCGRDE